MPDEQAAEQATDYMSPESRAAYAKRFEGILTGAQAVLTDPGASEDEKRRAEDIIFLYRAISLYQSISESTMEIVQAAAKVNERCDTQNLFDLQIAFNRGRA